MRALFLLIATLVVHSANAAEKLRFPAPKGALEAGHVILQPGIAEQDHYFLMEKYPVSSAISHYAKIFSKWRPCYWPEREWDAVPDASTEPPRLLHRLVRFWVGPSNTEWVMVSLQYNSRGLAQRANPDNDRQFVVVATRKTQDAKADLALIDAKCDEAPNKSLERTRGE